MLKEIQFLHGVLLFLFGMAAAVSGSNGSVLSVNPRILDSSSEIDRLINLNLEANEKKPERAATDPVFLRRVYLDIIGRIPTFDEVSSFLDSKQPEKRSELIHQLLNSEGYVSRQFNYWADLLRAKTRLRGLTANEYLGWMKESVRDNKPYDVFVRELLTAEGYIWDDGAAGYYLRDSGMPLDNLANTVQIFLGTQLVCAQCHDHPYDDWSQKQYYELAAFTYGIKTRGGSSLQSKFRKTYKKGKGLDPEVFRTARNMIRPLNYRVHETRQKLKLPKDYQYDDAKPNSVILPKTLFGHEANVGRGESRREQFADWLVSSENPRFTTVIANRTWKKVMGVGVIEPVDDFQEDARSSNPELTAYLDQTLRNLDYDLKAFQEILYNTQTYQRRSLITEQTEIKKHAFSGQILERMSAEQIWDSFLTLGVPDLDNRKGQVQNRNRYGDPRLLLDKEPEEILKIAETTLEQRKELLKLQKQSSSLRKKLRSAYKSKKRNKAKQYQVQLNVVNQRIKNIRNRAYSSGMVASRSKKGTPDPMDARWRVYPRTMVRASEIESPARPGHFLRQFGQSDRETIENANDEATVPQILSLLNGPMYEQLAKSNSTLHRATAAASNDLERLNVMYLSILGRYPTLQERDLLLPELKGNWRKGFADITWALLNTEEFLFIL